MSRIDELHLMMALLLHASDLLDRQAEEALALQAASDGLIAHLIEECEQLYAIALAAKPCAIAPGPTEDDTDRLFQLLKGYEAWTIAHQDDVVALSLRLDRQTSPISALSTRPPKARRRRTAPAVTKTA